MTRQIKIHNMPDYAKDYEFLVVRVVNGEYWFYGAYTNGFLADNIAVEIKNGVVVHNVRIQGRQRH